MTKEEAITLLKRYSSNVYYCNYRFSKRDIIALTSIYGKILIEKMIDAIEKSDEDPIYIVESFYYGFDDVLGSADESHFTTIRFASIMEKECGDILGYLRKKEKSSYEN